MMKQTSQNRIAPMKNLSFILMAGIVLLVIFGNAVSGLVIGPGFLQTGSIAVSSVPYQTTLSLDNRQVGVTPVVLNGISPGTHSVLLTSPEYLPYSQQVTVQAGATARVYAILIQKPMDIPTAGSIRISSTPSASTIYVDSRQVGVTPYTIGGLTAGQHRVMVTKQGYEDYNALVTVTNGTTTDLNVVLDQKQAAVSPSGSIFIISTPSSASVYLDNHLTGVTPETITGIAPGQHQLKIQKPGYLGVTRSVSVTDKQVTTVNVVLPVNPLIYF
jgi:hypothetical protein